MFPTYEARFGERPAEGESLRDLRSRMWHFMKQCEANYEGKNILIVTHEYPTWMLTHVAEDGARDGRHAKKKSGARILYPSPRFESFRKGDSPQRYGRG